LAPSWHVVLRHWQLSKDRHGLTIPFLIGVERFAAGDVRGADARNDVRALLESARSRHLDHGGYFLVCHCRNVGTLILREVFCSRPASDCLMISSLENQQSCALAARLETSFPGGDEFEFLLEVLSRDFGSAIDREAYSRIGLEFRKMSHEDYEMISCALDNGLQPHGCNTHPNFWP